MNLLNENSLASILTNCYQKPRYRACILFNTREGARALFSELIDIHNRDGIDGVDRFIRNSPPKINFENGSILTLVSTSQVEQVRGQRYHEALLHEDVMDYDAIVTLQSQICEYVNDWAMGNDINRGVFSYTGMDTEIFNTSLEVTFKEHTKKPNTRSGDVKVDDTSKKILDDFLDSFKINNSLEFGA